MQSHLEAFSQDTHLVKEMKEYFKRHSPNFTTENTHDLSDIFWHMAKTAKLLGLAIYEIKEVWVGPDELWQANYALRTLLKGLKFLRVVPPSESPKVMGLMGIHDPDALCCFNGMTTALGDGRRAKMRAQSSTTSGQCTIGLASCVINVSAIHPPHWTPSAAMPSRTANPQKREALTSHPHWCNCQQEAYGVNLT